MTASTETQRWEGKVRGRTTYVPLAAWWAALLAVLALGTTKASVSALIGAIGLWYVVGLVGERWSRKRAASGSSSISLSNGQLVIDGKRATAIIGAFANEHRVVVTRSVPFWARWSGHADGAILLEFESLVAAEGLVAGLGYGPGRAASFDAATAPPRWAPEPLAAFVALCVSQLLAPTSTPFIALGAAIVIALWSVMYATRWIRVTIGFDGAVVTDGQQVRSRIRAVDHRDGLAITTQDGRTSTLRVDTGACESMLLAAMSRSIRQPLAELSVESLGRDGRSASSWAADLRRLREAYRNELDSSQLWDVLRSPDASAALRAAAAIVLTADPVNKQPLLRIASDTAYPRLRVAIEAAVADDEEAMIAALEKIAGEQ